MIAKPKRVSNPFEITMYEAGKRPMREVAIAAQYTSHPSACIRQNDGSAASAGMRADAAGARGAVDVGSALEDSMAPTYYAGARSVCYLGFAMASRTDSCCAIVLGVG